MSFLASKPNLTALHRILSYRRPGRSKSEKAMIRQWIAPTGATADTFGNYVLQVGDSPILWSSHTDTVHTKDGQQRLINSSGLVSAEKSSCLGADCGAGVWIMLEMIRAKVPGLYVFHRDEETGGQGSAYIADQTPELLDNINVAVAFDRYGTQDIITHQGGRCCSDDFAHQMADKLNAAGLAYSPSPNGVFTDTANYTELVSECTNIAVGYKGHHTPNETLNVVHLIALRNAMIRTDWSTLAATRDPTVKEYAAWQNYEHYDDFGILDNPQRRRMVYAIEDNATLVADILAEYGLELNELEDEIYRRGGTVQL
jgi:peptidase M28-like protein